ncbi:AMP-binding protein [Xanthobacter wiegelii]|uniref:AMP-binding protein n=1 Tax=Xanthobacter wiegelii TaxID=3119913 RepID=UPI00372AE197
MTTISAMLVDQARLRPEAPAVVVDGTGMSWAELCDLSLRAATLLERRGLCPGDHVALLCGNRPAFLVAWFALAHLGAVTVSVNTGLVADGLRYSLRQSRTRTLVVAQDLLAEKQADLSPLSGDLDVIVMEDEPAFFTKLRALPPAAPHQGRPSDAVSIIYTSGTTGLPKGVLNCQQAFIASGRLMAQALGITERDRIMVFLPLFHTNPQMYAVMSALATGCTLVLRPKFSVSTFFDDARRFGCTLFTYVGSVLAMLASRLPGPEKDHPLTRCVGGGCPAEVWSAMEERFGIRPFELYGMTEVGGWVTANTIEDYRFGTCGRTRADMDVRVVDTEDNLLPAGVQGQIVVRPKDPFTLLLGYFDNSEATWEASRNLWFHTGDAGRFDADGFLTFCGRMKEIIRRAGENISPTEIELALLDLPAVADAAAVAVPDPVLGEEIKAVIVLQPGARLPDLRADLAGRLPAFMLPRYLQVVEQIPRTETHKILRRPLQENTVGVIDLVCAGREAG